MKLIVDGTSFTLRPSASWYERDYERLLLDHAETLFVEYHLVPFKMQVNSPFGTRIPDLALIDRAYRQWCVVEVELAHHSLRNHVLPQVETFVSGTYTQQHAEILLQAAPVLDGGRLRPLVQRSLPETVVIINEEAPEWFGPIRRAGGYTYVVEPYVSRAYELAFRVYGTLPSLPSVSVITRCELDPQLPNLLRLETHHALDAFSSKQIELLYEEKPTYWTLTSASKASWLLSIDRNPLQQDQVYEIRLIESDNLALVPVRSNRGERP